MMATKQKEKTVVCKPKIIKGGITLDKSLEPVYKPKQAKK